MKKVLGFIISVLFYLIGVAGLFTMILWLGGFLPFIPEISLGEYNPIVSLLVNAGLIALFGLQHSIMARMSFKAKWTEVVPKHLERSFFVIIAGLLCLAITFFWQPIEGSLWSVASGSILYYVLYGIYFFGIVFLLASTFLVNHFELFGLQQAYQNMVGTSPKPHQFTNRFFYKVIRHPIYLGLIMIFWSTPNMTLSHFTLALFFSIYIYIGVFYEEKDLVNQFGSTYETYQETVPKVIPFGMK